MDKPITVVRQEFIDALIKLINDSSLSAFVITPILESVTKKVEEVERQQYEADFKAYTEGEKENAEN